MEIASSFALPLPPEEAYRALLDIERVSPCVPGGELGPRESDGTYPAKMTVKLGPMRLVYTGSLRVAEQDERSRRAVLHATAQAAGGQGTVDATMTMLVKPDGPGSHVAVQTELSLTGRAAKLGRGLVDDVAGRVVADMAACMERELADASPPDEPGKTPRPGPSVVALVARALLGRLRNFGRKGQT
ncbi:MAG: carbon monoxide dehydrogenase [Actinobacteria bacterium]|nr:MAG: carbon monoxide dehydrogenase [Actinomycetota bacterium]